MNHCPPESRLLQNSKAKFLPSPQLIGSRSDRDLVCTRREGFCNFLESGGQHDRDVVEIVRGVVPITKHFGPGTTQRASRAFPS